MQELDLLILGAGWTSTFLIPLLQSTRLTFAATTRDGRTVASHPTLKWTFDPAETSAPDSPTNQFTPLPLAKAILITFPLTGPGQSSLLVKGYTAAHPRLQSPPHVVQLGSTGIWQVPQSELWTTRRSKYDTTSARAIAEDELLSLGGSVLNLAGLWGGSRDPSSWVGRVAKTKEQVAAKTSLHLVHGRDVARAVVAVLGKWEEAEGQRWMVTDGFVYDWWSLFVVWSGRGEERGQLGKWEPSEQSKWVFELMEEGEVRALPRSMEALGRCYDSREFWKTFGLSPSRQI